ncbi:Sap-like sulfolipid-1-addressing protein [Diaminobutyricimonas aerilata]|uniref:Sap-like sulfolipid-1-addressing protein n=1 Tax=Diaminobutyricimonas aerilata TaxID=1162967 RepID=A0A2M9CK89_9MICO|nr:GAP family protein [Diaminobutyricimonas aerilata]PJJ72290.1 Sap-like sulfolipid-1-addressing protein [Diaminobutyricimonas aerilata]
MTLELLATLGALALVDSLSIGTLLIPVFFLIAPRLRSGRMLVYLAAISGFYFVVGIALTLGATTVLTTFGDWLDTPTAYGIQFALGAALLITGIAMPTKKKDRPDDGSPRNGRLARWRDHAMTGRRPTAVISIAIAAGLMELATMVPYLAAVGQLSSAPLDTGSRLLLLAAYCVVMVLPALVLLVLRLVARRVVEPLLQRLAAWLERTGAETTAWILAIVGFLLLRDAAGHLEIFEWLGTLDTLDDR